MVFTEIWDYSFLWKGVISGLLISLSSSLIGVFLLIKRLSLLGAGLSHLAFGGIALAVLLNWEPTLFTFLYTLFFALLLEYLIEKKGLPADTLISLFFSLGVAIAVVVLGITENLGANIYSYLFGSILTVSQTEFISVILISFITLLFIFLNYRSLLLISFNEELAKLRGVNVRLLNYLLISIASLNVVLAIKAVGIILASSFVAIPPMSALLVSSSFLATLFISALVSLLSTAIGVFISLVWDIPPSGAIVLCMTFFFILFIFFKAFLHLRKRVLKAS